MITNKRIVGDNTAYIDKHIRTYSYSFIQYHIAHYNTSVSYFCGTVYNSPFVNYSLHMDILCHKPFIELFTHVKVLISYPYDNAVEFIFLGKNVFN